MLRILTLIICLPILIVLASFAISNEESISLRLWPTDFSIPAPVSAAILIAAAIGFFLGASLLWLSAISARMRARRAERACRDLEAELRTLRNRPAPVAPAMPSAAMTPAILPPPQTRAPAIAR